MARPPKKLTTQDQKLRHSSRRFVETLAAAVLDRPVERAEPDSTLAIAVANALANKQLSARKIQRWCVSAPKKAQFADLLAHLAQRKIDPDKVTQAWEWHRALRQRTYESGTVPRAREGFPEHLATAHIEWIRERESQLRAILVEVPIPGKIASWYGDEEYPSEREDDLVERLEILATARGPATRMLVTGHSGTGRGLALHFLAARLLSAYELDPRFPFPLYVGWQQFLRAIDRIARREGTDQTEQTAELARALFQAGGPPLGHWNAPRAGIPITGREALSRLQDSSIVVIIDRLPDSIEEFPPQYRASLIEIFCSANRLVGSGVKLDSLRREFVARGASITHVFRPLPLDLPQVAGRCRREILLNHPASGDLGRLGESVTLLRYPGVAGRAIAQIRAGLMGATSLTGNMCLAASLYVLDVLRRCGASIDRLEIKGRQFASDKIETSLNSNLESFFDQPGGNRADVLDFERMRSTKLSSLPYLTLADLIENRVKLDGTRGERLLSSLARDGHWLFEGFAESRRFVQSCLRRNPGPDSGPITFQTGDDPAKHITVPSRRLYEVLTRTDLSAARLMKAQKLVELPPEFVKDVVRRLEMNEYGRLLWHEVEPLWQSFIISLGFLPRLGSDESRNDNLTTVTRRLFEALSQLFNDERSNFPGQTTFRSYGAQAAACIVTETYLVEKLKELKSEDTSHTSRLIFLAEVAANLTMDFPVSNENGSAARSRQRQELADQLEAVLKTLFSKDKPDGYGHLRHARYHLWEAIARIATPERCRKAFRRLLLESKFLETWPPSPAESFEAVEAATAVGTLSALGVILDVQSIRPSQFVEGLLRYVRDEMNEKALWGNLEATSRLQVRAHMFLAFKHLTPLLRIADREKWLRSENWWNHEWDTPREIADEPGYVAWMLDWLRQELDSGVSLPQDLFDLVLSRVQKELGELSRSQSARFKKSTDPRPPELHSKDAVGSDSDFGDDEGTVADGFQGPSKVNFDRLTELIDLHHIPSQSS